MVFSGRHWVVLVALSALAVVPVSADSDGYYCVGPGFIAYQFSGVSVATNGHVLTVVRVGEEPGIGEARTVTLPGFQVHGMKCNHDSVELRAWDAVHVVDLSDPGRPRVGPVASIPRETLLQGFRSENLGDWSRPAVVPIDAADSEHGYELVIRKQEEEIEPAGILHRTTAELIRKDHDGRAVDRRVLYEGEFEETVD
jgi:hypothetical protein